MNTETTKQAAYESAVDKLDKAFAKGGVPSIKGFKRVLADYNRRINVLVDGAEMCARNLEDVNKTELAIARLQGERQAFQERFDWFAGLLNGRK
jgi:hypothetical protein